jgi:predicted RNA-binding protein associated with RNAse of E/G family
VPGVTEISVGETVQVRYGKWGGGRHYEFAMSRLGTDEHGVWLGAPAETTIQRPGYVFTASVEWVCCFARDAGWTAAFHPRDRHDIATYVDITTIPEWSRDGDPASDVVSMVDLDIDVIQRVSGELLIDDEDEFEQHRHSLGYPAEIVRLAQSTTAAVYAAIAGGDEPFNSVGQSWLAGYAEALTTGR